MAIRRYQTTDILWLMYFAHLIALQLSIFFAGSLFEKTAIQLSVSVLLIMIDCPLLAD